MTNNLLTIEVDAELVSEVHDICSDLGVEIEKVISDYLAFITELDDSEIEHVKELQNENEKAQWLAERYFEVREH